MNFTRCFKNHRRQSSTNIRKMSSELMKPIVNHQVAYCWPWPICSKPFQFEMHMPKTGFVPGEIIPINLRITNISLVHIKFVQIYLHQRIYYPHEDTVFRYENHIKCSKRIINIPQKESELYFDQFLTVPWVPPSSDGLSTPLKISYKFKIKVVVPGPKCSPTIEVPVTILNKSIQAINDLPSYEELASNELPSYNDAIMLKL
ncbi:hypothetical protein ACFFRR_000317 [Megaselia abdita]